MTFRSFNILFIACLISVFSWIPDQVSAQDSLSVKVDSSSVIELRIPEPSKIEEFANNPDFKYEGVPSNPDSFISRLLSFIIGWIALILGNPVGNFIVKSIFIGMVIWLVIVIINQMVGGELINILSGSNNKKGAPINIEKEELESLDFEALINEAIMNSDYHNATRYTYLLTLKKLTLRGLISWSKEKTNLDYERELTTSNIKTPFKQLTTYYSYVEYGDFTIDKYGFEKVQRYYNRLDKELSDG